MSTDNLDDLAAAEAAIGKVAPRVKARRAKIKDELDGRQRHESNVALGAAAIIKRSQDLRAKLAEEEGQLSDIDRMASAMLAAAELEPAEAEPTTPAPPAPPEEPPVPPQTATPPPPEPELVPIEPEPEPPAPEPEPQPTPAPVTTPVPVVVVRPWYWWLKRPSYLLTVLLAVLFGVIAFFVATGNVDEVGRQAVGDAEFAQTGWYKAVIVIVAVTFAAMVGALIGSVLDRKLDEE